MSLLEEIIQLAVEEHGFARLPGNYRALNEIINKVLDAATTKILEFGDSNGSQEEYHFCIMIASELDKLRDES